jgi:hypothetical protein
MSVVVSSSTPTLLKDLSNFFERIFWRQRQPFFGLSSVSFYLSASSVEPCRTLAGRNKSLLLYSFLARQCNEEKSVEMDESLEDDSSQIVDDDTVAASAVTASCKTTKS